MIDRKNPADESGSFNPFALAVAAIAISAVLVMGAVSLLAPAQATSERSPAAPYAVLGEGVGYLPAQYVNQAKEIEPMAPTF